MKLSVCRKLNARRLHRPAEEQRRFPERVGQVGHEHLADLVAGGAVQHQAERALGVVLADENDRAVKKRAAQTAAVQQQSAFEKFYRLAHCWSQFAPEMPGWQKNEAKTQALKAGNFFPAL